MVRSNSWIFSSALAKANKTKVSASAASKTDQVAAQTQEFDSFSKQIFQINEDVCHELEIDEEKMLRFYTDYEIKTFVPKLVMSSLLQNLIQLKEKEYFKAAKSFTPKIYHGINDFVKDEANLFFSKYWGNKMD